MTNRQDLWDLLVARQGQWIPRDDLNFVGGEDTRRRMSEIRTDIVASGQYRLDERKDPKGRLEYRLVEIEGEQHKASERFKYRCSKCQSHPIDFSRTQPTIDPRWRMGKCVYCRADPAIFVLVEDKPKAGDA